MNEIKTTAARSWEKLYPWLQHNGLAGFDPYIIREIPFYQWLTAWPQFLPLKVIRYPVLRFIESFPSLWIKLFDLKPKVISKGVGLLASSYLSAFKATGAQQYLTAADACFSWLLNNGLKGYSGKCWGLPFEWKMAKLIPAGTPGSVVTVTVGHAFWERFQLFGRQEDLETCRSICHFFASDLNCDHTSRKEVCFSYTPLDTTHILNASLFISEYLLRVGYHLQNPHWMDLGQKGITYVLNRQEADGSFWYYGLEDKGKISVSERSFIKIDGYHTGFNLRMFSKANEILKNQQIDRCIAKGLQFYIDHFIDQETGASFTHDKGHVHRNKINIHGCAEAVLTLNLFSQKDPSLNPLLLRVLTWIIRHLQDRTGFFYYEKTPFLTKKVAYIRWGQAWMARALTDILESRKD